MLICSELKNVFIKVKEMNLILDENRGIDIILSALCDKVSDTLFKIKDKYGNGFMVYENIMPDLEFINMNVTFYDPIIVNWKYQESGNKVFYLNHVEKLNHKETSNDKYDLLETGTILISQNNSRQILWLPNIEYRFFSVKFSLNWVNKVDSFISLPKSVIPFLKSYSNLVLLNVKNDKDVKLVTSQILRYKELISGDSYKVYLNGKIIELILLMLQNTTTISSIKNIKGTIHKDDYNKIKDYTNIITSPGYIPEKIDFVAKQMGMGRTKFQEVFKKLNGKTYYNFVLEVKMINAMEMLIDNKSVSEVAIVSGYSDISNFTHAFKKFFDILPSEI